MENTAGFDLNRAIADWRHHLDQSPACRADDLDELESHLRDAVEQLRAVGLSDAEALLVATRRVGPCQALEAEFAKINGGNVWLDRLLWMLLGAQAWLLTGTVADLFSRLAGWLVYRHFDGSGWLPSVPNGNIQPAGLALAIFANLLAIGTLYALCRMWIRRIGPRLPELLRQPGWLIRRVVWLCVAIFMASALYRLAMPVVAHRTSVQTFGNLVVSCAAADQVLFVVKTIAVAWLSVVLVRRRLQPLNPFATT